MKYITKTDGEGNTYKVPDPDSYQEIDYEERTYIKEQNKFRKRFSNRW